MFHAGYTERFRHEVVRQALARYEGMLKADREGHHPLYREREWNKEERRQHKKKKKTDWLTRGGHDTVILVSPTPSGELAKRFQKIVDANPGPVNIKIQEEGGITMIRKLQRTNPARTVGCESSDCLACKHGRGRGGECRKNNVGYELVCDQCGGENVCYVGKTGQNAYTIGGLSIFRTIKGK